MSEARLRGKELGLLTAHKTVEGFGFSPEGNEKAVKSIKLESNLISLASHKNHSGYSVQPVVPETEGNQLRGFYSNPD